MRKLIILLLCCGVLVSMVGCGGDTAPPPTESPPTTVSKTIITETLPVTVIEQTGKECPPTESVVQGTKPTTPVPTTTAVQKYETAKPTITNTSEEKVAPQFERTMTSITPQSTESTTTESVPLKEDLKNETIQEIAPEPETTPPEFDIQYWISFAKEYAISIGLSLDSAAIDCWDNPISANGRCIYLERDIISRLKRYANDEDITDVWIWADPAGNDYYDIYIGYA